MHARLLGYAATRMRTHNVDSILNNDRLLGKARTFASRYKTHYGGAASPEPEEVGGFLGLLID